MFLLVTKPRNDMKTLLINPPQTFFPGSLEAFVSLPLGIMYIAAVLETHGYDVEIFDSLVADLRLKNIGDAKHYGMSWEKIREQIRRHKPDIVGITNPSSAQVDNAIRVSEVAKDVDPSILTVVGGPHTSVRPAEFLEDARNVDVAVIGEGEYTMLDIMNCYEGKKDISEVEGIAYRRGDAVILNRKRAFIENLDALPFPSYHLVDMDKYLTPRGIRYRSTRRRARALREISMITSRGCPFNCVFCSIHLHMGKAWRSHSKEYVVEHIEHVVRNYGVEHIHFEDDNITLDVERFEGILDGLTEKGVKFSWDTPNGIRADKLTIDLLAKMKKTGCTDLTVGVESGDQFVLDTVIDKQLRLADVVKAARMCKSLNIPLAAFFVIGFPGETKENMERTVKFALMLRREYGVFMMLMIALPLYGTRLYEICKQKGYLTKELTPRAFCEGTQAHGVGLIKTEDFTPEEVKRLALEAISIQTKLSRIEHAKHPAVTVRKLLENPRVGFEFVRKAIGI